MYTADHKHVFGFFVMLIQVERFPLSSFFNYFITNLLIYPCSVM